MEMRYYGELVKVTQGFYKGCQGTIESIAEVEENHVDIDRFVYVYRLRLENSHITEHVHEYYLKTITLPKPKPPKGKVLKITKE